MLPKVFVIIPTYNESENISILLTKLIQNKLDLQIIIVDDSDVVNASHIEQKIDLLKNKYKIKNRIHLTHRNSKLGRGSAIFEGLNLAYNSNKNSLFFQMDADMSHDPQELQKFINKLKTTKSDVVIGSRYLKKSKIIDWPRYRLLLSKIINLYLKILFQINISDFTNGYRLYNQKSASCILKSKPNESGFIHLTEELYLLKECNLKISEIDTIFKDRMKGKSSVTLADLIDNFLGSIRIRFR